MKMKEGEAERGGQGNAKTEREEMSETKGGLRMRDRKLCTLASHFYSPRSTSGNHLSVSKCMDGRLALCRGSYYTGVFLSLALTRWQGRSSVLREARCTLSYCPTPSFMHSFLVSPLLNQSVFTSVLTVSAL